MAAREMVIGKFINQIGFRIDHSTVQQVKNTVESVKSGIKTVQGVADEVKKSVNPKNYKAAGCDQRNIDHTRKWGADHSEQAEPSGSSAKRAERDPGKCCIKRVLWPLLWLVFHGMQYGLHELHRLLHGELYWVLRGIVRQ